MDGNLSGHLLITGVELQIVSIFFMSLKNWPNLSNYGISIVLGKREFWPLHKSVVLLSSLRSRPILIHSALSSHCTLNFHLDGHLLKHLQPLMVFCLDRPLPLWWNLSFSSISHPFVNTARYAWRTSFLSRMQSIQSHYTYTGCFLTVRDPIRDPIQDPIRDPIRDWLFCFIV